MRQYMLNHTTWLISKMDPINIFLKSLLLLGEFPVGRCCCLNMILNTVLRRILKEAQGCVWMDDSQREFESIKEYLLEPPIFLLHIEGRPLIMYLTVLDNSMGCIFGQQDETGRK